MAILDIDLDTLPDSDAIPGGKYKLRIDNVSDPEKDKNSNEYVKITYAVIEGEFANRKISDNYVPTSGRAKLKKIVRAAKYKQRKLTQTQDLVGLELVAIVGMDKTEEFGEQNKIITYIVE